MTVWTVKDNLEDFGVECAAEEEFSGMHFVPNWTFSRYILKKMVFDFTDLAALETLAHGAPHQWDLRGSEAEVFLGQEDPVDHLLEVPLHLPLRGAGSEPHLIPIGDPCHLTECLLT